MDTFRILATIVFSLPFLWLGTLNWYVCFLRTFRGRTTSWVPRMQVSTLGEELLRRAAAGETEGALAVLTFLDDMLDCGMPAPELENALQISFIDPPRFA